MEHWAYLESEWLLIFKTTCLMFIGNLTLCGLYRRFGWMSWVETLSTFITILFTIACYIKDSDPRIGSDMSDVEIRTIFYRLMGCIFLDTTILITLCCVSAERTDFVRHASIKYKRDKINGWDSNNLPPLGFVVLYNALLIRLPFLICQFIYFIFLRILGFVALY